MLLLAAILVAPPPPQPAEAVALERALKAALPAGWKFVSGRVAEFGGYHAGTRWLATLEASKAGNFSLVVEIDHDRKGAQIGLDHSRCEYYLGVEAAGTKRSVADHFALPQCNVGDRLVIPIPVLPGDSNIKI